MLRLAEHADLWLNYIPCIRAEVNRDHPGPSNRRQRQYARRTFYQDSILTIKYTLFAFENLRVGADALLELCKAPSDTKALQKVHEVLEEELVIDYIGATPFNLADLIAAETNSTDAATQKEVQWNHNLGTAKSLLDSQAFRDLNPSSSARMHFRNQLHQMPNIPQFFEYEVTEPRPFGWSPAHDKLLVRCAFIDGLPAMWVTEFHRTSNMVVSAAWLRQRLCTLDLDKFDAPPDWNAKHAAELMARYTEDFEQWYHDIYESGLVEAEELDDINKCPPARTYFTELRESLVWNGQYFGHGWNVEGSGFSDEEWLCECSLVVRDPRVF